MKLLQSKKSTLGNGKRQSPSMKQARLLFTAGLVAVLISAALALGVRDYHRQPKEEMANPVARTASLPFAAATPAPRRMASSTALAVQFAIYDVGIYPRAVQVKAGLVAISIEDYSGGTAGLMVVRVDGQTFTPMGAAVREGSQWRGKTVLELTAGTYEVYSVEQPNNRAKLVVNP